MKSNTQNAKIEAITEKTLVLGIDVGSETHYARAFDYSGIEYSKKPLKLDVHVEENYDGRAQYFREYVADYLKDWIKKMNFPFHFLVILIFFTVFCMGIF